MESNIYEFSFGPKRPKLQKALAIIFNVFSIIDFVLIFLCVFMLWLEIALVFLIQMIIAMLLRNCFYIFYDYNFIDGDFRIFKLVNNKYRKKVAIFDNKNIISVGKVGGETFNEYYRDGVTRRKYAKSRNDLNENDIVVLVQIEGKQTLLILKNDVKYTTYLVRYAGVKKLDNDFVNYIKEGGLLLDE